MAKPPAGRSAQGHILPDVLKKGLKVVFCGWGVPNFSQKAKEYYAHPSHKFWSMLCKTGLTPGKLSSCEFKTLPKHGIGLTDVCKFQAGRPHPPVEKEDLSELVAKIEYYKPQVLAIHGKEISEIVLSCLWKIPARTVHYGRQKKTIGTSIVWVLPDTSSGNPHWETHTKFEYENYWQELADHVK